MRSILCLMAAMVSMMACNTDIEVNNEPLMPLMANDLMANEEVLWEEPSNIQVCWETPESYGLDDFDPNLHRYAEEKQWVRQAIEGSWSAANPVIRFVGWGNCNEVGAGIRIRVASDWIGPRVLNLGRLVDGVRGGMVLAFNFQELDEVWRRGGASTEAFASCLLSGNRKLCIEAIAIHEFGHALGLRHEQDRSNVTSPCDRDQPFRSAGGVVASEYDPQSIMNYCKENRLVIPELSPRDKEGILALYPPSGGARGTVSDWGRPSVFVEQGVLNVGKESVLFVTLESLAGVPLSQLPSLELPSVEGALEIVSSDKSKVVLSGDEWERSNFEDGTPSVFTRVRFTPSVAGYVEFYWHGRFVKNLTVF